MLFLTATPFQLGHAELCSVLERFGGIAWDSERAPRRGREAFDEDLRTLRRALDEAQRRAVELDTAWGRLDEDDLAVGERRFDDVEAWWSAARADPSALTPTAKTVMTRYELARRALKQAEALLRPWVIRHLKDRRLPPPHTNRPRRVSFPGRAILDESANGDEGIAIAREAVLPFLLAARATTYAASSRALFAEGLASSYETFLDTHALHDGDGGTGLDVDDEPSPGDEDESALLGWYLERLRRLIEQDGRRRLEAHPKLSATVRRAVELWRRGEKVVVYCHFIITGRVLRQAICEQIDTAIRHMAAKKLGIEPHGVPDELERIGKRFFDEDAPVRRACDAEVSKLLSGYPRLTPYREILLDVARRHVRTPSFLARFFPLESGQAGADEMVAALDAPDASGLTLREVLRSFCEFLENRCGAQQRHRYVDAVARIQTGTHVARDVRSSFSEDEIEQLGRGGRLLPNVRLVNGRTKPETRQRLMLAFNTPFYPEILVASSVMAEGVDLHLNCRHAIHHDLCWNPSTLEQRTGRIDRIGAKCERAGRPIHVYLPYVAETQDEKMYRVVTDRARWFSVVMGEQYQVDEKTAERLARRVPFPQAAAAELRFSLHVAGLEAGAVIAPTR